MRPETDRWWRQAQADLNTALAIRATDRYYAISWFVQQAVEKGLKALYIEQHGVLAPRTHDIERLGSEVGAPTELIPDLLLLNPTFEMIRYPDMAGGPIPVDAVNSQMAARHLAACERVLAWIATQL